MHKFHCVDAPEGARGVDTVAYASLVSPSGEICQCLRHCSFASKRVGIMKVGIVDRLSPAESNGAKYTSIGCSWAELESCKF